MTERRRLTLKDKLEIVIRQARCPLCNEKLGEIGTLDFDHEQALARGGVDANDNLRAVHRICHRVKTSGKPATSHGSDIYEIVKTKRLTKKQEAFRARLLARVQGEEPVERKKHPWPKRKITGNKKY